LASLLIEVLFEGKEPKKEDLQFDANKLC